MKPKFEDLFNCVKDQASAMNMKSLTQDKTVELIEYVLYKGHDNANGKNAWSCYENGLITERELRNLLMAHAATQISHSNNLSEPGYNNYVAKELCQKYEKALFGRPAIRHPIDDLDH
jgi:hypothetical protein